MRVVTCSQAVLQNDALSGLPDLGCHILGILPKGAAAGQGGEIRAVDSQTPDAISQLGLMALHHNPLAAHQP